MKNRNYIITKENQYKKLYKKTGKRYNLPVGNKTRYSAADIYRHKNAKGGKAAWATQSKKAITNSMAYR